MLPGFHGGKTKPSVSQSPQGMCYLIATQRLLCGGMLLLDQVEEPLNLSWETRCASLKAPSLILVGCHKTV